MKKNKIHNARLMREVKTISRMTHKNIVRYYQAWVEGSQYTDESSLSKAYSSKNEKSSVPVESSDDTDSASASGWWQKSPLLGAKNVADDGDKFKKLNDDGSNEDDGGSEGSSSSWSGASSSNSEMSYTSMLYQLQNPISTGFYFQETYENSFPTPLASSEKVLDTPSSTYKRDLYIQMEFCATTLRHLIDDGSITKMEEKEVWRLLRQITVRPSLLNYLRLGYTL